MTFPSAVPTVVDAKLFSIFVNRSVSRVLGALHRLFVFVHPRFEARDEGGFGH